MYWIRVQPNFVRQWCQLWFSNFESKTIQLYFTLLAFAFILNYQLLHKHLIPIVGFQSTFKTWRHHFVLQLLCTVGLFQTSVKTPSPASGFWEHRMEMYTAPKVNMEPKELTTGFAKWPLFEQWKWSWLFVLFVYSCLYNN